MVLEKIPFDYEPPEGEYDTFDDGKYQVSGLKWSSVDDDGRPILVAQKDGRLVGRSNLILEDGESGPPFSCELGLMSLVVKAFGGDISKLPALPKVSQAGKISAYMEAVQNLAQGNVLEVVVSKGWVNTIPGMDVPPGLYYYKLIGITPTDDGGSPKFLEGQYGPYFFVLSEILSGEGGSPTPYKGVVVKDILNYSMVVKTKGEELKPDWKRTDKGAVTKSAAILAHFMQYTAPSLFDGKHTFSDPYNILPDWLDAVMENPIPYKGYRVKEQGKKYISMSWATVEPVSDTAMRDASVQEEEPTSEDDSPPPWEKSPADERAENADVRAGQILIALLNFLADGEAFSNRELMTLSEAGKSVAKTHLTPLKQKGVLAKGTLSELGYDEVMAILENIEVEGKLQKQVDSYRHSLAAAGIGVEDESGQDDGGDF